jgi:hypothetical protein
MKHNPRPSNKKIISNKGRLNSYTINRFVVKGIFFPLALPSDGSAAAVRAWGFDLYWLRSSPEDVAYQQRVVVRQKGSCCFIAGNRILSFCVDRALTLRMATAHHSAAHDTRHTTH